MKYWMTLQMMALCRVYHGLLGGWVQDSEDPRLSWEASFQRDDTGCQVVWVLKD